MAHATPRQSCCCKFAFFVSVVSPTPAYTVVPVYYRCHRHYNPSDPLFDETCFVLKAGICESMLLTLATHVHAYNERTISYAHPSRVPVLQAQALIHMRRLASDGLAVIERTLNS